MGEGKEDRLYWSQCVAEASSRLDVPTTQLHQQSLSTQLSAQCKTLKLDKQTARNNTFT